MRRKILVVYTKCASDSVSLLILQLILTLAELMFLRIYVKTLNSIKNKYLQVI